MQIAANEAADILAASTETSPPAGPRSDGAGLSKALTSATDRINSDREHAEADAALSDAARALAEPAARPLHRSYSDGIRRSLAADLVTLSERRAHLMTRIAEDQAELDDVNLAIEIGEAGRAKGNAQSG